MLYASKVYHLELLELVINCLNLNEVNFNIPIELAEFLYVCLHSMNLATLDMDSAKIFSFVKDRFLEPIQCYKDGNELSDNEIKEEDNEERSTRSGNRNDEGAQVEGAQGEGAQGEVTGIQEYNIVEEEVADADGYSADHESESNNNVPRNRIAHKNIKICKNLSRRMRIVPLDIKKIEE
jgi:hypothetical protein